MASPTPPLYGAPIDLATALRVIEAGTKASLARGWPMAFAVVDSGTNLVALHKLDGTQHVSTEVAIRKAKTSVNFRRDTKGFQDFLATGGTALRVLTLPDIMVVEGGVLLFQDGKIIGALGVSGMAPGEDGEIAAEALKAL